MTSTKLIVLTPAAFRIEPECERGLRALEELGHTVRRVFGQAAIDVARSEMASRALREGFEHLIWIDSDIAFHPPDIQRLHSHGRPLVAGIYPKKNERTLACELLPETRELMLGKGGGLVEIQYAAGGFLYTHRSVYEKIQAACHLPECNRQFEKSTNGRQGSFVPYFMPMVVPSANGPRYLAEDYAFSHRARMAGISILADTGIRLYHLGEYPFGWEDAGEDKARRGAYHFKVAGAQETTPASGDASVGEIDPRSRRAAGGDNSQQIFPLREELD